MNAFPVPALHHGLMGCAICGKPLRLASAKSENGGLPVHEECYLLRLKLKQETTMSPESSESAGEHGTRAGQETSPNPASPAGS